MCNVHGATTRKSIYDDLLKALTDFSLSLENMSGLCTDGAPAMTGKANRLIGSLLKLPLWDNPPMPFMYHCVIHQENLAAQTLKMNHVMQVVVSAINFI